MDITAQLDFLAEIEQFKLIAREMWCSDKTTRESDADHVWHLGMFLLVFEDHYPDADMERMLKMVLVHDLVEIYAGDTYAFDQQARATKEAREQRAAERLFEQLPAGEAFLGLFEEYVTTKTREAKIVRGMDKLQSIFQNILSEGKSWKKHGITYEEIDAYKRPYVEEDPLLLDIYEQLMDRAKQYLPESQ